MYRLVTSRARFVSRRIHLPNNLIINPIQPKFNIYNISGGHFVSFSTCHQIINQQQEQPTPSTPDVTTTTTATNNLSDTTIAPTPKKKRRLVPLREPFKLTEAAAKRVLELLHNKENAVGLKVSMTRRGCNGLTTVLDYVYLGNVPKFHEEVTDKSGVKIYVDPSALMYVIGTVMDYVDDEVRSEFVFNNPNAQSSCGCGESVSVPEKVAKMNQKAIEKFRQLETTTTTQDSSNSGIGA